MKPTKIFGFGLLAIFVLPLGPLSTNAATMILPVEAIPDSGWMRKDDFRNRYPGIDISGDVPTEVGYYVRYVHDELTYFFGPIDTYSEAMEHLEKMEIIREDVIYERPPLRESTVDIYHFSFEKFGGLESLEKGLGEGLEVAEGEVSGEGSETGGGQGADGQDAGAEGGQIGEFSASQLGEMTGGAQGQDGRQGQQGSQGQQQGQQGQYSSTSYGSISSSSSRSSSSSSSRSRSRSQQSGGGGGPPIGSPSSGSPSQQRQQQQSLPLFQILRRIFGF